MSKKKGFTKDRYKEEILLVLKNQPFMSTNEVAESLSMGYDTTLKYLTELHKTSHIKLKTVGNRRFWYK
ncbi:MAG: hypothetical protein NT120_01285 [Candidatus Aenigmarchaeota archaeon]|nr:hypothetical protein [Candidatus Aenigmarchaeota archaeon]